MTDMLVAWVLAPTALLVLAIGAGLLMSTLVGEPRLGWLTAPVGVAVQVVVGTLVTLTPFASQAVWVMSAFAAAGWITWLLTRTSHPDRVDWPGVLAGLVTFAVFALPVVMSGAATWAGWVKLDDGASWLAFTDHVMSSGNTVPAPPTSTYDALINVNFASQDWGWFGYPRGAFPLLGAMSRLTGADAAWLIQPYLASMAALLALVLYWILVKVVRRRWLAALGAVTSASAALYYGYALWGGVKEVMLALLAAALCSVVALALSRPFAPRLLAYAAIVSCAVLALSGVNGLGLIAPVALAAILIAWLRRRPQHVVIVISAIAGVSVTVGLLLWKGYLGSGVRIGVQFPDMGNLVGPLNPWQAVGIWPTGDFRSSPESPVLTGVLIAAAVVLAVLGVVHALRLREWALPMLVGVNVVLIAYGQYTGDAWLAGKILAAASPAVLTASFAGVGWLLAAAKERTPSRPGLANAARASAAVSTVLLAAGVFWSDALAYHGAWIAPRDRQGELEYIGGAFDGQGPALLTTYDVYGARYFLRGLRAEAAGELRVHPIPLRTGELLQKGQSADVEAFPESSLAGYPLLVLRRSPLTSRPPAEYRLEWSGKYYEVWRRDGARGSTVESMPLQNGPQPAAVPECQQVLDLAGRSGGALVAAKRAPVIEVPFAASEGGQVSASSVTVPVAGSYELWLAGSFPGQLEVRVDGREVSTGGSVIEGDSGAVNALATLDLTPGTHIIEMQQTFPWFRPGSGAGPFTMGPMYLARQDAGDAELLRVPPSDAASLCGQEWDWIASVRP